MNSYQILLTILTVFIGFTTIFNEVKQNKVSNVIVLFGIIFGLFLTGFFVISGHLNKFELISTHDSVDYFINFFLVLISGFFLWKFDVIGAGIAKLLLVYAALAPITFIDETYLTFFPILVFIVNTLLLVLVYFLVEFIYFWGKVFISSEYRQSISWKPGTHLKDQEGKTIIENGLMFVGFLAILELMRSARFFLVSNLRTNSTDLLVLLIIVLTIIRQKARKMTDQRMFLFIIVASAAFLWWQSFRNSPNSIYPLMEGLIAILLVKFFSKRTFKKALKIFEANFWRKRTLINDFIWPMVPIHYFWKKIERDSSESEREIIAKIDVNRMTTEQTIWVRELAKKSGIEKIGVQKRFYISIWMFLGALVTIFARGPLLNILLELFHSI